MRQHSEGGGDPGRRPGPVGRGRLRRRWGSGGVAGGPVGLKAAASLAVGKRKEVGGKEAG